MALTFGLPRFYEKECTSHQSMQPMERLCSGAQPLFVFSLNNYIGRRSFRRPGIRTNRPFRKRQHISDELTGFSRIVLHRKDPTNPVGIPDITRIKPEVNFHRSIFKGKIATSDRKIEDYLFAIAAQYPDADADIWARWENLGAKFAKEKVNLVFI